MNIPNSLIEGVRRSTSGLEGAYSALSYKSDTAVFGVQYFAKLCLLEEFDSKFFGRERHDVFTEAVEAGLSEEGVARYLDLHDIGYLPIKLKALPEGTRCPAGVPLVTVENTRHEFAWLTSVIDELFAGALQLPIKAATESARWFSMLNDFCERTGGDAKGMGVQPLGKKEDDAIIVDMARMLFFEPGEVPGFEAVNHFYFGKSSKATPAQYKHVEAKELFVGKPVTLEARPSERVLLELEAEGIDAASFEENGETVVVDSEGQSASEGLLSQLNHSVNAQGFKSVSDRLLVKAKFDEAKALLEQLEQNGYASDCISFDVADSLTGSSLERGHGIIRTEVDGQAEGSYLSVAYRNGSLVCSQVPSSLQENGSLLGTVFEDGSIPEATDFKSIKERINRWQSLP